MHRRRNSSVEESAHRKVSYAEHSHQLDGGERASRHNDHDADHHYDDRCDSAADDFLHNNNDRAADHHDDNDNDNDNDNDDDDDDDNHHDHDD